MSTQESLEHVNGESVHLCTAQDMKILPDVVAWKSAWYIERRRLDTCSILARSPQSRRTSTQRTDQSDNNSQRDQKKTQIKKKKRPKKKIKR